MFWFFISSSIRWKVLFDYATSVGALDCSYLSYSWRRRVAEIKRIIDWDNFVISIKIIWNRVLTRPICNVWPNGTLRIVANTKLSQVNSLSCRTSFDSIIIVTGVVWFGVWGVWLKLNIISSRLEVVVSRRWLTAWNFSLDNVWNHCYFRILVIIIILLLQLSEPRKSILPQLFNRLRVPIWIRTWVLRYAFIRSLQDFIHLFFIQGWMRVAFIRIIPSLSLSPLVSSIG